MLRIFKGDGMGPVATAPIPWTLINTGIMARVRRRLRPKMTAQARAFAYWNEINPDDARIFTSDPHTLIGYQVESGDPGGLVFMN